MWRQTTISRHQGGEVGGGFVVPEHRASPASVSLQVLRMLAYRPQTRERALAAPLNHSLANPVEAAWSAPEEFGFM